MEQWKGIKMNLPLDRKILCGLMYMLLFFTVMASAAGESQVATASADGYASGDFAKVATEAIATNTEAYATGLAIASASDGKTAIAESTSQALFGDTVAYAHAIATAFSTIGETSWAQAYTEAIASSDGTAMSKSTSIVWSAGNYGSGGNIGGSGDNNNGGTNNKGVNNGGENGNNNQGNNGGSAGKDPANDNNGNGNIIITKPIIVQPIQNNVMFGFSFGKSDPGRYYYFKRVANSNGTLRLAGKNNVTDYTRSRAIGYMWQIAWDRGMNETQFENKFKESNYTKEVEDIIIKLNG